ncbi:NADPH-dependent FMN reductase [Eoetvoesiella caeni]|uniref:NAD(P)H-dependent FMN reductase n=1 Tax=Eoetvoesiella caeni TaxID=645616 RepID=A0A366HEM3_9BURK|nr:NADPH-dependent FMN reductase [Eoetvoesiella caeni]MCI2808535.1 NAD(P)H-dependent oxidoreductase [Eoetvoesiella caeni]NYT55075.1 NAD(P)H-dependent oxidoreductase [Eoetvoesiella caeni]RBP40946.1 NAD(P)H-dependent FMN reductase [Eoetvoesiella caeni]
MIKLIGIAGSLRRHSYNRGLLRTAVELAPAGATLQAVSIDDIPLYNGDIEEQGIPAAVARLKDEIEAADGLLLVTPEYNNGVPGVFKNAIDWASRPPADGQRIFTGKPVALIGASPGGFGTVLSQSGWLPVLRALGTQPWFEQRLLVSRAGERFDRDGNLVDAGVRQQLGLFVAGFGQYVQRCLEARPK